jgi:uncharacterized protein (TIGR03083 family)
VKAPSLADYIGAHTAMYDHYNELCRRITSDQLALQSLCPEWDIRGVISHVIGVEAVLDGWFPSAEQAPPFERIGAFAAQAAELDPESLSGLVAATTSSRLDHLRSLAPEVIDAPSITPTGIKTYSDFLRVRIFDLWVHARDIALPMGEQLDVTGTAAAMALDEVARAAGYIVGKKIGLPNGMSILFHLTGDVGRDLAVVVDERAAEVDFVASPDVEITADVETFVLLACGRINPQIQIAEGKITWSGDPEWGRRAAHNLTYTM